MVVKGQRMATDTMTKFIDMIFYRHADIIRAVKTARMEEDICMKSGGNGTGHSLVSDPTAIKGIQLAMELKEVTLFDGRVVLYPERCIQCVDEAYNKMDTLEKSVTLARYAETEKSVDTCRKLGISKDTYFKIINNSRTTGKLIAVQLGLIRVI